ncbi:tetratricopeptide repeat protein [Nonomuraea phyllanthi]|uniref:Tetratricopeptide repeat protein n=1 Tax=Nonomuraea phyllanthi TaxID=2219224 RepID=A0A5C4WFF2_9ACTN|nr:tetratricopeptide repeat protein [Nonomuraea phyllanthi]KAB8193604.1 tetratricopeptide repeat protein [Nonomuraea phyllanthi]QFY12345.1 tetratricopeptide repeat protein [Nonomuraea phyllanthi]
MDTITLDADRRIDGPYTFAAALLGRLVPQALERVPGLVAAHDIEIRAAAPRLREVVAERRRSLAASLPIGQRVLVPGARRSLRVANGLAEFVRDHLRDAGPLAVTVTNLGEADPTDTELIAVLRRRVDPGLLTIEEGPSAPSDGPLCADFDRFRDEGFHHAMAESGLHALAGLAYEEDPQRWRHLLQRTAASLEAIEREDDARELYDRSRRESTDPRHRATVAYATAMILVRHHDPARRDPEQALAWINEAITITSLLPDRADRAFHLGFDLNGKALVEVRRGRFDAAMDLVRQAIELAETDLADQHPIHRLVLYGNRAQLLAMAGRTEEALADYTRAVEADPGYPDYYLERGNLLLRLGRTDEALADYEAVMRLSPPFPEAYYNRAELRFAAGDLDGARADLDHTLELDPEFAAAYVNRSGIMAGLGEHEQARRDVVRGLALAPRDPHLLCVLGQVELAEGRPAEARTAFDAALEADPALVAAWAGRAELAFGRGEHDAALADLTRALELAETAELLFNRSVVYRAAGLAGKARDDLLRAAQLDPEDEDVGRALAEV